MSISAQVSLYPLGETSLGPAIDAVLAIFVGYGLVVEPGAMSSVISGESDTLFAALEAAFSHVAAQGQVVMVVTLSNACPVSVPKEHRQDTQPL